MCASCLRRSWNEFARQQPCAEALEQRRMRFNTGCQQTLAQSIGKRRARRAHADIARSDLPVGHAVIVAGVLCRPCCPADLAGGKSGVLELDDAVTCAWDSD